MRSRFKVPVATARIFNPKGILPSSPGLRAASYPGEMGPVAANPNGVASIRGERRTQPRWDWGLGAQFTQGSSLLATLGFGTESLWDSMGLIMSQAV
jgi:hypothetical protein